MLLTRPLKQQGTKQVKLLLDQLQRVLSITGSQIPSVQYWLGYISAYSSLKNHKTQKTFTIDEWKQLSETITMIIYAESEKLIKVQNVFQLIIYGLCSEISTKNGGADIGRINQSLKTHLGELTADNDYLKRHYFTVPTLANQRKNHSNIINQESKPRKQQQMKERQQPIGLGIQCSICLNEVTFLTVCPVSCGHNLHKNCLIEHFKSKVEVKKFPILCPQQGCNVQLQVQDIQEYIPKQLMQKFYQFSLHQFVNKNKKNTNWCPTPGCTTVFSYDGQLLQYRCLSCKKNYCLKCKTESHDGMTCAQNRQLQNMPQDEKQFMNFAKGAKMKQCPSCKFWVEKNKGCDHMTCRCSYQFCFRCGAKYGQGQCKCDQNNSFYGDDDDDDDDVFSGDEQDLQMQSQMRRFQEAQYHSGSDSSNNGQRIRHENQENIRRRMPIFLGRGNRLNRRPHQEGIRIGGRQQVNYREGFARHLNQEKNREKLQKQQSEDQEHQMIQQLKKRQRRDKDQDNDKKKSQDKNKSSNLFNLFKRI